MASLQEYKCPCCGGAIEWNTTLQKLKCPYCDTEFDQDVLQSYEEDLMEDGEDQMDWQEHPQSQWQAAETQDIRVFTCNSCGGEIIGDKDMGATSCPYCGNPSILPSAFKGELRPDYIIPFKLDKKAAKEGLKKHLKGKRLLPRIFTSESHIDEIKGIYVPFWLFDAEASAHARFHATSSTSWMDSKYTSTETKHFSVSRNGKIKFEHVAIDGSSKMDDQMMESIEPFDFADAVPFSTGYLAGFLADCYDVTAEESIGRANERIRNSTEEMMKDSVKGYETVIPENMSIQLHNSKATYALYPIWLLNTTWKGNVYTFAMNGQTGKFIGDLPVDQGAAGRMFGAISAGVAAAVFGISYLLWMIM